jgi:hypothetical protein
MRVQVVEISWHNDVLPVLSCDIDPVSQRIATSGADANIRLWRQIPSKVKKIN